MKLTVDQALQQGVAAHKEGKLRMVASDGHRLSLIEKKVDLPSLPDWPSVILPKKGLVETRTDGCWATDIGRYLFARTKLLATVYSYRNMLLHMQDLIESELFQSNPYC